MNFSDTFLNFWSWYGAGELNATFKGSKTEAMKAFEKAHKRWAKDNKELADTSEAEFGKAIRHGYMLHEQNRKNARKSNGFVPRLKNASTWLNQSCWEHDVVRGSGDYLQDQKEPAARKCACGQEPIGRDAAGGWICRPCFEKEWVDEIRKTTDMARIRWTPRNMLGEYPKPQDETWAQWSQRVAKQIIRKAPENSALAALKPVERVSDHEWFTTRGWRG